MIATDPRFDIVLVYFIYGLAFFCMGLVMTMEARRSPVLAEARVLLPLAFFGIVHGMHEWLEIALEVRRWFGFEDPLMLPLVRLAFLVVSFVSLILFGMQAFRPNRGLLANSNLYVAAGLLVLCTFLVLTFGILYGDLNEVWMLNLDVFARYTLAIPGAGLAAMAFLRQAGEPLARSQRNLAASLRLAGVGFAVYGITQLLVAPADFFPASVMNSAAFLDWAGFPIQAVRAGMAVLITVGLYSATQVVEEERQRRLAAAQEARLQALEQVRHELAERELMRRELMRHTIVAQEDERARIARELHDETAQFLTALSLDMATLRNSLQRNPGAVSILERLQSMNHHMSQGIYRMVRDLRPAQLDDLGLASALHSLAESGQKMGLQVNVRVEGSRQRMEPLVETGLYRIAQEALSNVARHSGCAEAEIILIFGANECRLAVCDRGLGFDPGESLRPPKGWGLAGMRERAESLSGRLEIQSSPGKGTRIDVWVPCQRAEQDRVEETADDHNPLDAGR